MNSSNPNLSYEKVTHENLDLLLSLHHQIWPDSEVDTDYLAKPDYPDDDSDVSDVSWIIYHDDTPIGLTGTFSFDSSYPGFDHGDSIWMDWFAILPDYRGKGFGKQVLLDTIEYCRKLGKHKYFRIDTSNRPGRPAVKLYDEVMPLREEYTAERPANPEYSYLIYSCNLGDWPVQPWNNKYLDLNSEAEGKSII